jgi:hypothetical protein
MAQCKFCAAEFRCKRATQVFCDKECQQRWWRREYRRVRDWYREQQEAAEQQGAAE